MGNSESRVSKVTDTWKDTVMTEAGPVKIRVCRMRDLKIVGTFVASIAGDLGVGRDGSVQADLQDASLILKLIANKSDEAYQAVGKLTDWEAEDLLDLNIDDGLKVVMTAYELNKDFFKQKVYPIVKPFMELLGLNVELKDKQSKTQTEQSSTES